MADCARVRLRRAADGVEVEFRDRGRPSTRLPLRTPIFTRRLEERRDGGLGIHLVREIMRDVHYEREGEWNRITHEAPGSAPDGSENRKG